MRPDWKYPQFWGPNCLGSWMPSAGCTGNRLIDYSGRGNHGSLTNISVGTEWVPSDGVLSLELDGSNDYVDCGGKVPLDSDNWVMSMWIYRYTSGSNSRMFSYFGDGPTFWVSAGSLSIVHSATIDFNCNITVAQKLQHLCVSRRGTSIVAYLNGVVTARSDSFAATYTSDTSVRIGSSTSFGEYTRCRVLGGWSHRRLNEIDIKIMALHPHVTHELQGRRRCRAPSAGATYFRRTLTLRTGSRGAT